jgi:GT2 family glycosyltransferase
MEERLEMSLENPRVSIVIVNRNCVDGLWHCLFSMKTQTHIPYEIILVDNASKDTSVPFVRANYPQVKILECQENFGPAMAFNLGVKYATGDLVALLKSDTVATPDWLTRMIMDFKKGWPRIGALTSANGTQGETIGSPQVQSSLNILGRPVPAYFDESDSVFYPDGPSLLFPRFLTPEGPFDLDFFSGQEDVYLGWRLRSLKRDIRRSATAKIFQTGGGQEDFSQWKDIYYRTRNRWLNLFYFYEKRNLIKVLPLVMAETIFRLLKSLFTGLDLFLGTTLALVWILTHPLAIYRKRRAIQEKRKVPDGEILKFLSGRLAEDGIIFSRLLNFISLFYCGLFGLEVLEFQPD